MRTDPRLRTARLVLGAALLGLLAYLLFGAKPWSEGIAGRVRAGLPIRPIDVARTWGWYTAATNALVVGVLLATARRWIGPADAPESPALAPPPRRGLRAFALLVLAAMATSALLAWPRLSFGFWDDEEVNVECCLDGRFLRDGAGALHFEEVAWRDTWWDSEQGHNHVPMTILGRLSLAIWRRATHPSLAFADERAVRLPAWLAGIAAIGASALFLRRLGFGAAGACAAWLLALHPSHLRYASEARGYALCFLLLPLTWTALIAALHRGSWRRWIAFGAAQCALLWSHPSMVYPLAFTNLAALGALWGLQSGTPRLREQGLRWLVVCALGAAVFAQLMLPHLVDVLAYLEHWRGEVHGFGAALLASTLAHLFAGVPWRVREPEHYVALSEVARAAPGLFRIGVGATLALLSLGALRLLRARGPRAWLVPALLLPGPLLYAVSWARQDRFFEWYVVFALPGLAALVSLGLTWPLAVSGTARVRALAAAATIGFLALFGVLTAAPRAALRERPIVMMKESVLRARPTLDPFAAENARIMTVSFQPSSIYYDPLLRWARDGPGLEALIAEADAAGAELYVNVRFGLVAKRTPELAAIVEDETRFGRVAILRGYEAGNERRVYRLRRHDAEH